MGLAASAGRGQEPRVDRPRDLSAGGWWDVLSSVKDRVAEDRLTIIAAGVAFYALLAVFPALATLFSIYGLMFDPQAVTQQLGSLRGVVPGRAVDLVLGQVQALQGHRGALGWGAAGGILVTLWTSSLGVNALIKALNAAYDTRAQRGYLRRAGLALVLTVCAIVVAMVAIAAIVVLPALAGRASEGTWITGLIQVLRWPVIAAVFWLGAAVIYRYGPCRQRPAWHGVNWGAAVATALWLFGSGLFSWFVANFGRYNETYGSMGAVVILLLWFLLSAFAILVGAAINAELERRIAEHGLRRWHPIDRQRDES
ncbi:MAG TPA: YihY/virulence factor BrkB family protein [Polyangiaceae bacterium]|nr:YihY/virulence factor BrkB family protein [Polyangiaceae bacterium]